MRRRLLTALLPLALLLAVVPVNGSAGNGTIHGQIVDADTNQAPTVALQTQACQGGPTCIAGTPSETDGSFTISVPAGTYNIRSLSDDPNCGPNAYTLANKNSVAVGDGLTVNVQLLVTRHKGSVGGRITNTSGQGVTALVVVDNSEQGGFGQSGVNTDSSGNYLASCLQSGRGYYVSVFPAAGYLSSSNAGYTVADNTTTPGSLTVQQGNSHINGNVTCLGFSQGCGGQSAQVLIVQECASGCASWVGATDPATGNYSSGPLAAGAYAIHIFSPTGWDNQAIFNIFVGANRTVQAPKIGIYMQGQGRSGRMVGNVSDAAGAPYANCNFNAFNTGPATTDLAHGFITGILTDVNGNYDTGYTLAPGTQWKVYLDCPGHSELSTDTYANGSHIAVGPQYGVDTATRNFFWPEPARPWTGGHDAIGLAQPSTDAYFAEGFTGLSPSYAYHEYFTVQNPNAFSETLSVDYFLDSGTVLTKTYALPAQSRTTLTVNAEVGPNHRVAAHLHTDKTLIPVPTFVAERPMYFMFPGGIDGGHDVMGAPSTGTHFYFAEGFTGLGFHEVISLVNPDMANDASVSVTYYFNNGAPPVTKPYTVKAHSPFTIDVNEQAGNGLEVSVQVTSTIPVVAERTMYFPYPSSSGTLTGGHVVVGSQQPSAHLNLAEGYAGNGFYEYLTLLNPGPTDATVTITYNRNGASPITASMIVPANSRRTRIVNDDLPPATENSVHIESKTADGLADVPLVVERPMYFNFAGRTGGHDAMAVDDSQLSTTYNFAEGFVASCSGHPCFDEFYTILNNTATDAQVTITYFLTGGGTKTVPFTVGQHSRYTRWVNHDLGNYTANSALVASTNGVPILAERPMYFSY